MRSKKSLEIIRNRFLCENNWFKEDLDIIKEDLEVLEILKEYSYSHDDNTLFIALDCMKFDELKKIIPKGIIFEIESRGMEIDYLNGCKVHKRIRIKKEKIRKRRFNPYW